MSSPMDTVPSNLQSPPHEHPSSDQVMAEAPDSPPHYPGIHHAQQYQPGASSSSSATHQQATGGSGATKLAQGAPGATWSSKKFQDEYTRTEISLTDLNWDHTKYGDPLVQK